MRRLTCLSIALCSVVASAAEVTRVASSFEERRPFGMFLDFTFDRLQDTGRIVREWYEVDGVDHTVSELSYARYETSLGLEAHLGIFRDVEFKIAVPIIFQQDRSWRFAAGRDASNTTIYQNYLGANGQVGATDSNQPGAGTGRLFEVGAPSTSYRGGLGDFTFGLAWAPFVQRKDPSKPTWVLRFDYTAPTAALLDPSFTTSSTKRGAVGERLHKYTFTTALSRRLSFAEPYFVLHYTLPWRGPGFSSNCDHPSSEDMAAPGNCGLGAWTRAETGLRPSHTGGVQFGSELTVFERPEYHQRVAFDLRGWLTYVSEGRVYNELSDQLHKLLVTQDYGQLGAQLAFVGQAAEFIILKASASLAYDTEHVLTGEAIARASAGGSSDPVDITPSSDGQPNINLNPNFDYRVDRPGRRFIMKDQVLFRIQVTATFNF
jgi:hypothetical protein